MKNNSIQKYRILNIIHPSSVTFYLRYAPPLLSTLFLSLADCAPVQWKFIHFHGQKTSRQSRYKSIFRESGHKRTKGFRVLSLILFFTPDVHLRELKRVWADELIIEEIWRNFMQKLVSEWVEFVLYVSCVFCFLEINNENRFGTKTDSQLLCSLQMSHFLPSRASLLSQQRVQDGS